MAQDSRRALWVGVETTEGTLATQLKMLPCISFVTNPKDTRLRVKEYKNSRVRDGRVVRAKKYNELTIKTLVRFDLFGWMATSLFGQPTNAAHASSTLASNIQTLQGGTTITAGNYYLTIGGYQTAAIAFNATAGAVSTAINLLPSVVTAGNCTVANGPLNTATAMTFTFGSNLASVPIPTIVIDQSGLTNSGAAITVTQTTPGTGAYDNTFTGGNSNMPTLSFVYFDGVSFKSYTGASVNSLDLSVSVDKYLEADWKCLSRFETDNPSGLLQAQTTVATANAVGVSTCTPASMTNIAVGKMLQVTDATAANNNEVVTVTATTSTTFTAGFQYAHSSSFKVNPIKLPILIEAAYQQPIDASQMAITIAAAAFNDIKTLKYSIKGNRLPLHTIGGGVDMTRATEGEFNVDFDFTARYYFYDTSATAASQYKNYITNTQPGALVITATDTTSTAGAFAGAGVPTFTLTLATPNIEEGDIDSMKPESEQTIKGYSQLDAATATDITLLLTNQEKRYTTLT